MSIEKSCTVVFPYYLEVRVVDLGDLGYRGVMVFFDKRYIDDFLPYGRARLGELVRVLCGGDPGSCTGYYIGDEEEHAVETFLNEVVRPLVMRRLNVLLPKFQVSEEPGCGLPPYSLYWSSDVRSWCGRWTWNARQLYDVEAELCFGFCRDEEEIKEIGNVALRGLEEAESRGLHYVFAFWVE